jgi:hypothetical protein
MKFPNIPVRHDYWIVPEDSFCLNFPVLPIATVLFRAFLDVLQKTNKKSRTSKHLLDSGVKRVKKSKELLKIGT